MPAKKVAVKRDGHSVRACCVNWMVVARTRGEHGMPDHRGDEQPSPELTITR